jgi:hypothetical protein
MRTKPALHHISLTAAALLPLASAETDTFLTRETLTGEWDACVTH